MLGGVGDATRLAEQNLTPANLSAGGPANGLSWFSLWTPETAINLASAGGNLVVSTQAAVAAGGGDQQENAIATDNRFLYPPTLTAVASSGSIYAGSDPQQGQPVPSSIELAPSPTGELKLLAAQSIYDNSLPSGQAQSFDISGASTALLPNPLNAAFTVVGGASNETSGIGAQPLSLFAFEADTATGTLHQGDPNPALIYAGGDIVDMLYGETLNFVSTPITPSIWYISGKSVRIVAGGDIVEAGTLGNQKVVPPGGSSQDTTTSGLIVNSNPTDVSVIQAGGEILYANATIAGPGQLYVQAGGNVYQGNLGTLESLGPLSNGTLTGGPQRTGGAGITVLAGAGAAGPDWQAFAQTYLAPAMGYGPTLLSYLQDTLGYQVDAADAGALFDTLPIEQQRSLLLQIYFNELAISSSGYNTLGSPHYKSYIQGREAIASLFPDQSATGGGITLFGDAGIRSDFGGSVVLLSPAGGTTLGVATGPLPASTAGVLTQGEGDVDIFSQQSVILGQSRVFTTFGGKVVIWSVAGDINAGRGSKTTQLVSSTAIVFDPFGRITLTPGLPTSGAGIATLAPVPGIKSGDVDLAAPLGTIDAGEAGIRASGNVNLASLTVVNAANIQVGGKVSGVPTVVAPNVSALSAASATAAAAAQTAQAASAAAGAQTSQPVPSDITVDVIGFGEP